MKEHKLNILPEFFQAIDDGHKTFEVRYDDRNYETGDVLCLNEWNYVEQAYTGRSIKCRVTYILSACSGIGLQSGYVCMSIEVQP